jgi:hypothetical protein
MTMNAEIKECQNCKHEFTIEPDDFSFYERMQVPPPTWCPECRRQRRFVWRNERSLYKRKSDLSGKDIICLYSPDKPFKVYEQKEWWGDDWDAMSYGRAYNFSKPFFEQFRELQREVPRISISNQKCVNSDYTNQSYSNKNCYLCFSIADSEDCIYSANINESKQLLDDLYVSKSELLYECVDADQCYNSSFLVNSDNCLNSAFLFDCKSCQNCTGCVGLRNKQYVFWGEQLSKEEYEKKIKDLHLDTYDGREMAKAKFADLILKFPRKSQRFKKCVNSTGDLLTNCKNVKWGFSAYDLEDCRYITRIYTCKDTHDSYGLGEAELIYETIGNQTVYNVKFANITSDSRNCTYSDLCFNSENCFGCIGLKKKQYCILNKQYSKEEYEALIPKIIQQMNDMPYTDGKGRVYKYGEFFPIELSPFAYNETIAQENFPLTKEEIQARKYIWKDPEKRDYKVTMKSSDLPGSIAETDDSILNQVIECAHNEQCSEQCTQAFRITPEELSFYRRMNLPLPRLCPNCRHYQRLAERNPLELWHRKCQCAGTKSENGVYANTASHTHGENHCPNEFETSYPEGGKEIVYCEDCYNAEVV